MHTNVARNSRGREGRERGLKEGDKREGERGGERVRVRLCQLAVVRTYMRQQLLRQSKAASVTLCQRGAGDGHTLPALMSVETMLADALKLATLARPGVERSTLSFQSGTAV